MFPAVVRRVTDHAPEPKTLEALQSARMLEGVHEDGMHGRVVAGQGRRDRDGDRARGVRVLEDVVVVADDQDGVEAVGGAAMVLERVVDDGSGAGIHVRYGGM